MRSRPARVAAWTTRRRSARSSPRALAEDVGAGDLTADAVVPHGARGEAPGSPRRRPGSLYGFDVAGEVMRQCGVERFEAEAAEGEWRDEVPARGRDRHRPGGLAAGRRAHRAELPRPPLRDRHPHRPLRRRGRRHRGADPRHPQDDPGPAGAREAGAVAAGGGINHRMGLYDAILIKENHIALAGGLEVGGRASARGREGGRGRVPRPRRGRPGDRRRRRPDPARQHGPGGAARGGRAAGAGPMRRSSRPRGASTWRTSARWRRPGSSSSRSAR